MSSTNVHTQNSNTSPNVLTTQSRYSSSNDGTTLNRNRSTNDVTPQHRTTSSKDVTTQDTNTSPNNVQLKSKNVSLNDVTTQNDNTLLNDVITSSIITSPNGVITQDSNTSLKDSTTQTSKTLTIVSVYNLTTFQQSSKTMTDSKYMTTSKILMSLVSYNVHSTSESVVENTTYLCNCHCYEDPNKPSLKEWISDIRRKLLISKDTLVSQARKLKSATDPRFSSYVIGMSGVAFLVGFGVLFLLFDVSKMFAYILNRCERQSSHINKRYV